MTDDRTEPSAISRQQEFGERKMETTPTRARGAPWELLSIDRPALVMLDLVA
jgi:hypothetical protein